MKPLLKWPGGKTKEIVNIQHLIPDNVNRYIEPFVGGGAVFFHLKHHNNIINDIDTDLISFYNNVKNQDKEFFNEIDRIMNDWKELTRLVKPTYENFSSNVKTFTQSNEKITNGKLKQKIDSWVKSSFKQSITNMKSESIDIFYDFLLTSMGSKISRISQLEIQNDKSLEDRYGEHLETAIKAAYYTMIRDLEINDDKKINARFFFLREFCYGSMFRFNAEGKFNIPYGGINYNTKDIQTKVDYLRSDEVLELLSNTEIFREDFESLFKKIDLKEDDFIFLDPPYDSDFKDYGKNPFNISDQIRLAEALSITPAKFILIINKSEDIFDIYTKIRDKNENIKITDYDKVYSYNVRGRNERGAKHLLITNFSQERIEEQVLESFFS